MSKNILMNFIKEHKISYTFGIIFMLLSSYIQTLFPKVLGNIFDILKEKNFSHPEVYKNILFVLLIALGTFVCTYLWRNFVIGNARNMECELREKLFEHFQTLTLEFYNKRKTGDLIAYGINDINAVRMAFGPATAMCINGIVICIISIYSMVRAVSWQLTVLALLPVPFIIFFMLKIGVIVRKRFKKVQETFASISDRVQENINGIRVIKSYVQEDEEVDKFEKLNNEMAEANLDMVRISAYLSPLIEICFTLSFVLNLILGGDMVLKGTITIGEFIAFNGYLTMILGPILSIGRVITIFQRGMASLNRLNEIFSVKSSIVDGEVGIDAPARGNIQIKDLYLKYEGSEEAALTNINLSIPRGHTIGILGNTGSGKSTLVNLLLKMYKVKPGTITFDGVDINDFNLDALRNSIGFVPQDNFLFNASIKDNIKFFKNNYSDEEVIEATKNSCIYSNIMEFQKGFDTVLGERGVNISGGQKQRISIARALIKDPEILILDDALSAVDTITEAEILENFKRVRKNKTSIIIAHRISAVIDADEIVVLDKGRIVEKGTHAELLEKGGFYYEIYRDQFQKKNLASGSEAS